MTWLRESIASDESGKGDFYGGPVVAAAHVNGQIIGTLGDYVHRIQDSKLLSNSWIMGHAPKIMEILGGNNYAYRVYKPAEYNRMYSQMGNLNILISVMHHGVHMELKSKLGSSPFSVIDAFTTRGKYLEYLRGQGMAGEVSDMVERAESKYLSCAIASIIARYYFMVEMAELSREFGVNLPFGNSYGGHNSVIDAFRKLQSRGINPSDVCKTHFSTLKKITR